MEAAEDASKPKAEELSVDVTRFEELERDFQDVLNTLVKDNSLDKFRREYEKLHAALKKVRSGCGRACAPSVPAFD